MAEEIEVNEPPPPPPLPIESEGDPEDAENDNDDQSEGSIPPPPPLPQEYQDEPEYADDEVDQPEPVPNIPPPPPLPAQVAVSDVAPPLVLRDEKPAKVYTTTMIIPPLETAADNEVDNSSNSKTKVDRTELKQTESKPQKIDIMSKLKFFESEIEKEKEGVAQLRKASADLLKYRGRSWKWSQNCHGKYNNAKSCGCDGSGGSASDSDRSRSVSPAFVNLKVRVSPTKVIGRISVEKMSIVPRRRKNTAEEATSTNSIWQENALKSKALVLTKQIKEIPNLNTNEEFRKMLADTRNELVFVQFYALWSRPCQKMGPTVLELANENQDVMFFQIDIDKEEVSDIVEEFDVDHVPAFFCFKNGSQIAKMEGTTTKATLKDWIRRNK